MKNNTESPQVGLYVGMDWAGESHYFVARDPDGQTLDEGYIVNRADGFEELFEKLDSMREGKDVAVIFEATRGAIHFALIGVSWLRLCPVNPVKT